MFSRESKQSKRFCDLALKAIPGSSRKDARAIYKSIKHGNNETFDDVDATATLSTTRPYSRMKRENAQNCISDVVFTQKGHPHSFLILRMHSISKRDLCYHTVIPTQPRWIGITLFSVFAMKFPQQWVPLWRQQYNRWKWMIWFHQRTIWVRRR